MAKVVIIGAGFAGHTAALYMRKHLNPREHEIIVINKYDYFLFVPGLVWVGVDRMKAKKTSFPLAPVYKRRGIKFVQGMARAIHPDENYVLVQEAKDADALTRMDYDYLLVATGPKLDYDATEGLGAEKGNAVSICNLPHAEEAAEEYLKMVKRMEAGEHIRFVMGTGHPAATCQGAAFEYIANIHRDLQHRNLRDKATLTWISNEQAVGDFGVRGLAAKVGNEIVSSEQFMSAVFDEYGIEYMVQRGVHKIDTEKIYWEDFDGNYGETPYDFAMLIPKFSGPTLKWIGADGSDISGRVTNGGFVRVDAIYGLDWEALRDTPEAWPATYRSPEYRNIFAAGIAFAPPGSISKPHVTPNGTAITAAPPRTGMVSAVTGRIAGLNIVDLITKNKTTHSERMTEMVAACIASMGDSLWDGSAAAMILYPVVPDMQRYPHTEGRDMFTTHMEMGVSGAWMKRMTHATMMYKMQGNPGWALIPE